MSKSLQSPSSRAVSHNQRGVTLIEALVALLVMSFGMLALVGLMSNLRRGADVAKQRSEAMRIARAEMAKLRTFSSLTRGASTPATDTVYDEIVTPPTDTQVTPADSNATYSVQRVVTAVPGVQAKQVRVAVSWVDRASEVQVVRLDTIIAAVDPLFSAAVGFTPPAGAITQPSARNPAIPATAKQLDKSISAFKPSTLSSTVWIFNNQTGVITGVCAPSIAMSALTAADVDSCKNNTFGYLLSGAVRFSNASPPNPSLPEANAIPMLNPSIIGGTYSLPRLNAQGVPVTSGGSMVLDSFTATAPPSVSVAASGSQPAQLAPDCFQDAPSVTPSTQPFVTYNCIVYPPDTGASGSRPTWSGKLILNGFATGTTASEYRVCRYSADYNGSGGGFTPDWKGLENEEHPAVYAKVAYSLTRQNFLVVRGDLSCPTAPAVDPSTGVFADYSTIQLQP